jgi:hypothetical protein
MRETVGRNDRRLLWATNKIAIQTRVPNRLTPEYR